MVQNVLEVERDVQIETLFTRRSTRSLWATWSNWATHSRSARASCDDVWTAGATRSRSRRRCVTTVDRAESKRPTNSQIHNKRSRRLSEVSRNDLLTRKRYQIEIAKRRASDRREGTVGVWTSKAGTFIHLPVQIQVLPGDDIERWTTGRDRERIQHDLPPRQIDRAEDRKPVTNIKRSTAKLT